MLPALAAPAADAPADPAAMLARDGRRDTPGWVHDPSTIIKCRGAHTLAIRPWSWPADGWPVAGPMP